MNSRNPNNYHRPGNKFPLHLEFKENSLPPLAKQVGKITIMFVKIDNNSIIKSDIAIIPKTVLPLPSTAFVIFDNITPFLTR